MSVIKLTSFSFASILSLFAYNNPIKNYQYCHHKLHYYKKNYQNNTSIVPPSWISNWANNISCNNWVKQKKRTRALLCLHKFNKVEHSRAFNEHSTAHVCVLLINLQFIQFKKIKSNRKLYKKGKFFFLNKFKIKISLNWFFLNTLLNSV